MAPQRLLKAAINAVVDDERLIGGAEDVRYETAAQIGLCPHLGQVKPGIYLSTRGSRLLPTPRPVPLLAFS